jgi:hypothetical protein
MGMSVNNNMPVQSAQNNGAAGLPKKSGSERRLDHIQIKEMLDLVKTSITTKSAQKLAIKGLEQVIKLQRKDEEKIEAVKNEIDKIELVIELLNVDKDKATNAEGLAEDRYERISDLLNESKAILQPQLNQAKLKLKLEHKSLFDQIFKLPSDLLTKNEKIVAVVKKIVMALAYLLLFGYLHDLIQYLVSTDKGTILERAKGEAKDPKLFAKLVKQIGIGSERKENLVKELKKLERELKAIDRKIQVQEAKADRRETKLEKLQANILVDSKKGSESAAPYTGPDFEAENGYTGPDFEAENGYTGPDFDAENGYTGPDFDAENGYTGPDFDAEPSVDYAKESKENKTLALKSQVRVRPHAPLLPPVDQNAKPTGKIENFDEIMKLFEETATPSLQVGPQPSDLAAEVKGKNAIFEDAMKLFKETATPSLQVGPQPSHLAAEVNAKNAIFEDAMRLFEENKNPSVELKAQPQPQPSAKRTQEQIRENFFKKWGIKFK